MTDQHAAYLRAYEEARTRLLALAGPLSEDAFNLKPAPGKWSVAECIAHLNIMAEGYLPALERAVRNPDAPRAQGPFRYGFVSRLFIEAVRPGGRALPTGPAMAPPKADGLRSALPKAETLAALDRTTEGYLAVARAADGLDLRRIRVRSPFIPVWFSLGAYLDALGQHALRHTAQAERAAPGGS